ncbi:uncharacterized protein LOC105173620 [Sesamum indicum]|uniref:Uncharacterized protein LOC105173620 n=1 Tax=Sesamum indicum TaxID=4182 RepID=A0A6I9U8G6_SESIN|nr:uncharacterized protein LOC105173620 [Sesamum indicum]
MEMEEGSCSTTGNGVVVGDEAQEDDNSVMDSWLIVDDDTASELSKLLDLFGTPPPPIKVRFIDDPYSTSLIFQSSSAYVTINGNEESCGSSFSDSDSSVMASIDIGGARRCRGPWVLDCAEAREWWMEGGIVGEADWDVELEGFLPGGCEYADDSEDATWVEFLEEIFGQLKEETAKEKIVD